MPDATVLALLQSIDTSLKVIAQAAARMGVAAPQGGGKTASGAVAPDSVLDDPKWGDPVVKFEPRDWTGAPCKGLPMSRCPSEFLEMLASTFDYFADQAEAKGEVTNTGKPVAPYKRMDASRARGWARRNKGKDMTAPATDGDWGGGVEGWK